MIKFKTQAEQEEFLGLPTKNERLFKLVQALSTFVELEFKKDIILTEVYRSQLEFDALYAKTPPEKRPARSPHQDNQAVDLRSSIYTQDEIDRIVSFVNCFRYGSKKACIYHAIAGNVAHLHIQYV